MQHNTLSDRANTSAGEGSAAANQPTIENEAELVSADQQKAIAPADTTTAPGFAPTDSTVSSATASGGKKKMGLLLGMVIAVIILGGSAAAYFSAIAPMKNDQILEQALANSFDSTKVKSNRFAGTLQLTGKKIPKTLTGLTFSGAAAENKDFSLSATANLTTTAVTVDIRQIGGKDEYLRVSGLDKIDTLLAAVGINNKKDTAVATQLGPVFASVNNQWFQLDQSTLQQYAGSSGSLATSPELSQADTQKLATSFKANPFLTVQTRLADEKINSIDSYHYAVVLNKVKLKQFLESIKQAELSILTGDQTTIDQLEQASAKVDFSKASFELWISKSDIVIDQISTNYTADDGTTVKMRLSLKDFNQVKSIDKPTGAKSFQELFNAILPGLVTGNLSQLQ